MQTTLTKGCPGNLGHVQMDKQGMLFFWNILLVHERHHNSYYRVPVALFKVNRMFSSKNPDDSPKALAHFPFIPYP